MTDLVRHARHPGFGADTSAVQADGSGNGTTTFAAPFDGSDATFAPTPWTPADELPVAGMDALGSGGMAAVQLMEETSTAAANLPAGSGSGAPAAQGTSAAGNISAAGTSIEPASHGLVIDISYDDSVASAPAGFKTTVNAAVAYLESLFSTPITVTIDVGYGEIGGDRMSGGDLGESESSGDFYDYQDVLSALQGRTATADEIAAAASLPSTDPTPSGSTFYVAEAEAEALGLSSSTGQTVGDIGLALDGGDTKFTYGTTNAATAGHYDAFGVVEHEITEVLGRTDDLGQYDPPTYTPLDLFRYSSAGVRDLTQTAGSFSVNGTDMLYQFNDPSNGGDAGDWSTNVPDDSFDAFSNQGVANPISATDLRVMDVIGYTPAGVTPSTLASWLFPISDDWNTPSDWSDGDTPDSTAVNVQISQAGVYIVSISTGESFSIDALTLADASGTNGPLAIVGSGAALTAVGGIEVGEAGTGVLLIESQGTAITGTSTLAVGFDVGTQAGASGAVTVSGRQSLLLNTGEVVVGDGGLGSLSIQAGATVTTALGSVSIPAAAVIAAQSGAGGSSVNVTGAGSGFRVGGSLVVGDAGAGSLAITLGGTVTATTLDVGSKSDSSGIVSISGNNSSLAVTGTLSVGDAGSGELSILSGANVNIGGDFDIGQTTGGTGDVDIEDPTGTVFVGGNLNLGDGAAGVLTVGPNSTLEVDNGGVIAGPHGVENLFSAIDPFFSDGGTANILDSANQIYKAYVESTSFNLSPGITYTLSTPIIYGSSGFALGVNSSDSSGVELILNADSLSAASNVTFNDALSTLVIGADVLPSIELPASGTGPFTAAANPNLGLPLIGGFDGTIKDFQVGDTIIVDTKVAATFHQNGSLVSVIANTTTLGVLTFDSLANATLAVITPGALVDQAPCFAAGTRIATERGEVAVEDLCVGDLVRVVLGGGAKGDGLIGHGPKGDGPVVGGPIGHGPKGDSPMSSGPTGDGVAPVIWVGRREVDCARHPKPRTVWPVRVAAGAFGPGQPHTDLFLSPDHAVYVGEVLIPVKHLINGSTIVQVPVGRITYHHIELAQHDVLLAQGLPAESFLDIRDGTNYANRSGPVRLYPDYSVRMWEAFGCARLIVTGPELMTARALVERFIATKRAA